MSIETNCERVIKISLKMRQLLDFKIAYSKIKSVKLLTSPNMED